MRKLTPLVLVIGCLTGLLPAQKKSSPALPERYKVWLETEVVYIITGKERDVFRELGTDRERELFIEAFWKQRDPTPGTPRNEFKEEHYKRLKYANEYLGRGTPKPGWKTDMGRVYVILGPPQNIEDHTDINGVYPVQIWDYAGDPAYGLPTGFRIIFFKKHGLGEYVLYSPVNDGPESLIADWGTGLTADYMTDSQSGRAAYQQLIKLAPNLAYQTLSLIPGEQVMPGTVSLASERLLADVFSSPQKKVEDKYAEAMLKYKDIVEVDYSANYISSDSFVDVIRDNAGFFFVHYSVEPKKISVNSFENKFSANFELNGRISDLGGNTVFQFTKDIPLSFTGEQLKDVEATSLALQDMFPLVPGTYKLDLLLKNTVSKEFSSMEETIVVPEDAAAPRLGPLLLGYQLQKGAAPSREFVPFKTPSGQLLCQARKTFARKESLFVFFQAGGLGPELSSQGKIKFTFYKKEAEFLTKMRGIGEYGPGPDLLEEFPLAEFPPDYYKIKVSVLNADGNEIVAADEDFEVTMAADLPRPMIISRVMPGSRAEEYDYALGIQMLNLGRDTEAYAFLEKAYAKNPAQLRYALGISQVLFAGKEYQRVKDILAPFAQAEAPADQVYFLIGKSCHALGQYAEAVTYYQNYLSRFGVNLEILNLLGMAHYRLGNSAEALQAWRKSLEINPGQEDVKKLVESLEKK
jgi:GWxTD domain-containing protein